MTQDVKDTIEFEDMFEDSEFVVFEDGEFECVYFSCPDCCFWLKETDDCRATENLAKRLVPEYFI